RPSYNSSAGYAYAQPHAPIAACTGARVRRVVRAVCCVELDRASAHAPPRPRRRAHMNWRIRLTWWDKLLLAIMAVAAVIAFVRFATGIGTVAHINNTYPAGWWGGHSIITLLSHGRPR